MDKETVLFYGALLESDMYADGYGSTDEDAGLLRRALIKVYKINSPASEEEQREGDSKLQEDLKRLVITYREKIKKYLDE